MRVVFFGTPAVAAEYLPLIAQDHELVGVVTQPDRRVGRGRKISAPPVKQAALELGLPVLQPESLKDTELLRQLRGLAADAFVVVAYGRILPRSVIEMATKGSTNVHYSLLPRLRGAAPVQRALMEGLTETGVTVQYIVEELDAGDIILQQSVAIGPHDNTATLTKRLTAAGLVLLREALRRIEADEVCAQRQDHKAVTYAPPLTKEEGRIDWCRPAQEIVNQIRACFPWPGAVSSLQGQSLKITKAKSLSVGQYEKGDYGAIVEIIPAKGLIVQATPGAVLIEEVQPAGRRIMSAADYIRGTRLKPGARFQPVCN